MVVEDAIKKSKVDSLVVISFVVTCNQELKTYGKVRVRKFSCFSVSVVAIMWNVTVLVLVY